MNLDHLKLFIRAAHTYNISQAGKELGLSPAVASAHISKLEKDLGIRLLHRTTRKVSITEDGHAFVRYAEDVIDSIEAAKASVGIGNASPRGTLRIAAPASFGRMHLLPAIPKFLTKYPQISIDLKLSDTIIDLVEGGFDIAIRNAEMTDSSLIARKLAADTRVICAAPDYLSEHGLPTNPSDLYEHNCITLNNVDRWSFLGPEGQINIKAKGNFSTDNGEAIRDACIAGLGITINSRWSAYKELASGKLVELLPEYPLVSDTAIWAVYPSSRQLAPKVRSLIDYLIEYFGSVPYWDKYGS